MWDWTNGGAQLPGRDIANFGYRDVFDGITAYVIGFHFRATYATGALQTLFSQRDVRSIAVAGLAIRLFNEQMYFYHDNAVAGPTPVIALNTTYSYLVTWDTTVGLRLYRNGVIWFTDVAFLNAPTIHKSLGITIGAQQDAFYLGPAGQVGNIAVWPSVNMKVADAVMWHNGVMPHRGSIRFFHRCTALPGKDEYLRQIPDCYRAEFGANLFLPLLFYDNVSLYSDPSDDYYPLHGETRHDEMQAIAGEELHRRRLAKKSYQITVPIEFLTEDLGEDLQVTHKGGLECTGEGFGYGDAPERLVRIEGMALDPGDRTVGLTLRDIKRHAVSYYNSFRAPFTITGRQLGVFQLIPTYAAKETIRASYSWGQDIGGIYQEFGTNQEPLTGDGLLVESRKENYFFDSAFKGQLGGWAILDPGAGTVTAEAPDVRVFDGSITGYAIKMVCGPAPGADWVLIRQQIVAPVPGGDMTLSFIYSAPTGGEIGLEIARGSDGFTLQTLTGGWAFPSVILHPPLATSYKEPVRYVVPYVFDGGDTYLINFIAGVSAGRTNWMYHAQFEEGKFATGPIVSPLPPDTYVRQGSVVQLRNPDGLLLPKEHGTIVFEFEPLWDDDEDTTSKYLMRLGHDANNMIVLYWFEPTSSLLGTFKYNGVDHFSFFSGLSWSAGDTLKVAIRWLGAGELGKATAQGQIFAKVGSGAWQEAVPVEFTQVLQAVAESFLYIGSWGTGGVIDEHNCADGYIRYLHCFPEALLFEEIQALLGDPA